MKGAVFVLTLQNVKSKFEEFHEKYSNQSIDDYDVFVQSRVIEYYVNTFQVPADSIMDLLIRSLSGNDVAELSEAEKVEVTPNTATDTTSIISLKHKTPNPKKLTVLPLVLSVLAVGLYAILRKKTRKEVE